MGISSANFSNKMKKILSTLVVIAVVVVWCSFQAYSDYSWSENVIGKPWNATRYDKDGNIIEKWMKGEMESI